MDPPPTTDPEELKDSSPEDPADAADPPQPTEPNDQVEPPQNDPTAEFQEQNFQPIPDSQEFYDPYQEEDWELDEQDFPYYPQEIPGEYGYYPEQDYFDYNNYDYNQFYPEQDAPSLQTLFYANQEQNDEDDEEDYEEDANQPWTQFQSDANPTQDWSGRITEQNNEQSQPPPRPTDQLMGHKSFRYLSTRVLANHLQSTEDERMAKIKARLGFMKQVSPPVDSVSVLHGRGDFWETNSREELGGRTLPDYNDRDWAFANASTFLNTQRLPGCKQDDTESKTPTGLPTSTPVVDDKTKRRAERAIFRFMATSSKPKYPLSRFILPRHQELGRVEKSLIGPGSYDPNYSCDDDRCRISSSWKSCSKRFKNERVEHPGSSFIRDGHFIWDQACERMRHPGSVPLFQSTPCGFRYKNFYIGCSLGPGHYNIQTPSKCSTPCSWSKGSDYKFCPQSCGPCPSTKSPQSELGPGSYNPKAPDCSRRKGHFSKTPRDKMQGFRAAYCNPLWPVDKGFPGPASYQPYEKEEWTENAWAAFNVGSEGRKLDDLEKNKLLAPDFYDYNPEPGVLPERKDIIGNGCRSDFLSKSPMGVDGVRFAALKERNRASRPELYDTKKKGEECVSRRL